MAILNFINTGSYSTVEDVHLDRRQPRVLFNLNVYQDATKKVMLHSIPYTLDGSTDILSVGGEVSTPLDGNGGLDIAALEISAVPVVLLGSGYDDHVFTNKAGTWTVDAPFENMVVFRSDLSKYFIYDGDELVEQPVDFFTSSEFDSNFSITAISGNDTNIIKQIYVYLLNRSDFSGSISD